MCLTPCLIIVFAAIVSAFYIHFGARRKVDVSPAKSWRSKTWYRLEYEQLSEGIRARDNASIIAGTILITASILLLGYTVQLKYSYLGGSPNSLMETLMVLASLSIYIVWLLCFNLTSRMINNLGYRRLEKMEEIGCSEDRHFDGVTCGIHHFYSKYIEGKWWRHVRRLVWLFFFWVLVSVGIAILMIPK